MLFVTNHNSLISSAPILSLQDIEIRQIIYSWYHIFILKNDGSLFVSDNNFYGKLFKLDSSDSNEMNKLTLIMTNENIILVNGITVEKIIWIPMIFHTLSMNKRIEIFGYVGLSLL